MTHSSSPPTSSAAAKRGARSISPLTWTWFGVWVASLLAHGVSCFSSGAFWLDEADSVAFSRLSLPEMWQSLVYDTFPLAHVLIFKGWLALFSFLPPETALRGFGFLMGAGVSTAFLLFARRFSPDAVPLLFALFSLNIAVIRFIDCARPYGISTLLFLILLYNALAALESGRRHHIWLAIAAGFLAVHSHYLNVLGVLAVGLVTLTVGYSFQHFHRYAARQVALGLVVSLTSMAIYLPILREAASWVPLTRQYTSGLLFPLNWMLSGLSLSKPTVWIFTVAFSFLLFAAQIPSIRKGNKKPTAPDSASELSGAPAAADFPRQVFCLACACLSFLFLTSGLLLANSTVAPWYYIPTLALCAAGLTPPWSLLTRSLKRGQPLLIMVVVLFGGIQLYDGRTHLTLPMSNVDQVAATVERSATSRDLVLVSPWPSGVTFHHYYQGSAKFVTVPVLADNSIVRYDLVGEVLKSPAPIAPVKTLIDQTLQRGGRIFLVGELAEKDVALAKAELAKLPIGLQLKSARGVWETEITAYLARHAPRKRKLIPKSECFSGECAPLHVLEAEKTIQTHFRPAP